MKVKSLSPVQLSATPRSEEHTSELQGGQVLNLGLYLLSNSYSAIAHCPHEMYLRTNLEYFMTTEWNHSMCLVYLS